MEWAPVYHVKGWGKFKRHYGDFCTGADTEVPAGSNGIWGTSFLHNSGGLTQEEVDGIISKCLRIYYVSWLAWTDLQNRMDWSDDCRWLQIPDGPWPYSGELVWHFCNATN